MASISEFADRNRADNDKLKRIVISLIRAHYESDSKSFKDASEEAARHFDERGLSQLSSYIRVLDGDDKNVWVPMDY